MAAAKHLFMEFLHDTSEGLEIELADYSDNVPTARFKVTYKTYPAYRNIQEEYRLELWERRKCMGDEAPRGWTLIVPNSPWVLDFASEPVLDLFNPGIVHYMITTENDVIEVLSNEPPQIECLGKD